MRRFVSLLVVLVALLAAAGDVASASAGASRTRTARSHGVVRCRPHRRCPKRKPTRRPSARTNKATPARASAAKRVAAKPVAPGVTTPAPLAVASAGLATPVSGTPVSSSTPAAAGSTAGETGLAAGTAPIGSTTAPVTTAPARLQVTGREYSLTLSHPSIAAGAAIVEFDDAGEDPHNLHIRPAADGPDVTAWALEYPGDHNQQSFSLAPGTYVLYCSLPGHEALGMEATLTVN